MKQARGSSHARGPASHASDPMDENTFPPWGYEGRHLVVGPAVNICGKVENKHPCVAEQCVYHAAVRDDEPVSMVDLDDLATIAIKCVERPARPLIC